MIKKKVVLKRRPAGQPVVEDFGIVEEEMGDVGPEQVLVEVEHLSVDAFIRTTLDGDEESLHGTIAIDTPVIALGVGRVTASEFAGLAVGDAVFGPLGAQTHLVGPGVMFRKLPEGTPPRQYLGALGMTTGLTAYAGLINVGAVSEGETVVVSAAAGAVGTMACQIAKIRGARVIGIAGGPRKVRFLVDEIGCDGAVDYKTDGVADALRELAPDGIDLYFDNVGGELLDTVLDQISSGARVVICGAISQYNDRANVRGPNLYLRLAERNASMRGFTVDHFTADFPSMEQDIRGWLASGDLEMPEHVVQGIEGFPGALAMLFTGGHRGKLLVAP